MTRWVADRRAPLVPQHEPDTTADATGTPAPRPEPDGTHAAQPDIPARSPDRSNEPKEGEVFGTEFLDNVAHQMVAPLQSIEMHCTNIIDGEVVGEDVGKRLREVVGHARMLSELARRMRFLHELVSDRVIDTEKLAFEQIVTIWIDGFNNYLPLVRQYGFNVEIDHETMNSLSDVIASHLAAHQVLMNIYDNAMKYGKPNTTITVRAKRESPFIVNEITHAAQIPVTVESAAKIGTRGFRSDAAKKLRASGTGLGMWISKRLMAAMQGELFVLPTTPAGLTRIVVKWRIA